MKSLLVLPILLSMILVASIGSAYADSTSSIRTDNFSYSPGPLLLDTAYGTVLLPILVPPVASLAEPVILEFILAFV